MKSCLKENVEQTKKEQKWNQSINFTLRMSWQVFFEVFIQAPSFKLQKTLQKYIGRNGGFSSENSKFVKSGFIT
jgi:hypothetical protein